MSALVSVVIPAFNSESFLQEAVFSVMAQTYNNLEIIIVVDKSKDRTAYVAESLCHNNNSILLKILPFNVGAATARNIGIEMASGDFIAFLDADDIWMPNKLESQIALFSKPQPPLLVFSDYCSLVESTHSEKIIRSPSQSVTLKGILRTNSICTSSAIYDIRGGKVYFPNLMRRQDWALWIILLSRQNAYAKSVPSCLVKHRIHRNSLSSDRLASYWYNYIVLRKIGRLSIFNAMISWVYHLFISVLRRI